MRQNYRYSKSYSYRPPPWANSYGREDSYYGSRSFSPPRSSRTWSRPPKRHENGSSYSGSSAKRSRSESSSNNKGIQMLVTSNEFPSKHLTDEQLELLQSAILNEISKIGAEDFSPQFLDSFKRRGNLIIVCNNQDSVDWLKKTVPELKPWENPDLKTLEPGEVPNLVDILITVSGKVDVDIFLRRVEKQNDNINANTWNLISKKEDEEEKTTILTFSVEESISENIKKAGYNVFYNFSKLYVKVLGSLRSKDDKKSEVKNEEKKESEEKTEEDPVKTENEEGSGQNEGAEPSTEAAAKSE